MSTPKPQWQPQQLIPLILAVGLLVIFAYVAWKVVLTSGQAPRLGDVTPSTTPSLAPGTKDYPPQYRGGFDENARLLTLIAIVSPLLTTIVGFYFGHQVGDAKVRAVQAQANESYAQIERIGMQSKGTAPEFVNDLKTHGFLKGITL